jgi:hypothetical protein
MYFLYQYAEQVLINTLHKIMALHYATDMLNVSTFVFTYPNFSNLHKAYNIISGY